MKTKSRKPKRVSCPKKGCSWTSRSTDPHASAALLKDHKEHRH